MVRNKFILKSFSLLGIVLIVQSTVVPGVTYALTSGPTAPEATSFEPVDTSSMVDALTGDMTYGVPLLEVPGPSGGYPLSLSYHAGIMPNEEASWVGLGWTLNPGAISRSVSGYPDDHDNVPDVDQEVWEGGESKTTQIGITVPLHGYASVDASLTISRDTYRGFSVQENVNVRLNTGPFQVDESGNVVGVTVPVSGKIGKVGNFNGAVSYNTSSGLSASGSLQMGAASVSLSSNGSIGVKYGALGMNMSSQGNSYSIAGLTMTKTANNNKSGKISTSTKSSGLNLGFLSYRKTYQRYWINETSKIKTFGSLYFPETLPSLSTLDDKSFDTYDLPTNKNFNNQNAVNKLGGSFVDYDTYSVNAQGVGGTMRPYHYYKHLLRQTELNSDGEVTIESYPLNAFEQVTQFKFENEFSNRVSFSGNVNNANTPFLKWNGDNDYFDIKNTDIITGENGDDGMINGSLITKSPIRYYTNAQIRDGVGLSGFIECTAPGFNRSTLGLECNNQVGAFTVTNESGVNYHYSLPAYSYDEYIYSGRTDEKGKDFINQKKRLTKYAYTWFLTGVTGPDYVDRNNNGKTDKGDYGYWVDFQYGKWTDGYEWRNPAQGVNRDLDQAFSTFSKGKKELYYLNSISTETHTALFVKEIRKDAKSTVSQYDEAVIIEDLKEKYRDNGGHRAVPRFLPDVDETRGYEEGNYYYAHAKSTLKLNKILLLKNEETNLFDIEAQGLYNHAFAYSYRDKNGNARTFLDKYHYGDNVIDIGDFEDRESALLKGTVKGIDFKTSYRLADKSPNSFTEFTAYRWLRGDQRQGAPPRNIERFGKLTLESLSFFGEKGQGTNLIPPLKFDYDLDLAPIDVTFNLLEDKIITDQPLEEGGIFKLEQYDDYFLVTSENEDNTFNYIFLDPNVRSLNRGGFPDDIPLAGPARQVRISQSKNPNYLRDFYDIWGFFKSDYSPDGKRQGSSFGRRVTDLSAKSVDVWSLRKIDNGIGSIISLVYETDFYEKSVIGGGMMIPLNSITKEGDNSVKVHLPESISFTDVQNAKNPINVAVVGVYKNPGAVGTIPSCEGDELWENCQIENDYYLSHHWQSSKVSESDLTYDPNSHTITINTRFTGLEGMTGETIAVPYDGTRSCCRNGDKVANYNTPNKWPDFIGTAAIEVFSRYGGGIRVKSIEVSDGLNKRRTSYEYHNGMTSYEPLGVLRPELRQDFLDEIATHSRPDIHIAEVTKDYSRMINARFNELMSIVRELPSPNVLYKKVNIRDGVDEAGKGWIPIEEYKELVFNTYLSGDNPDVGVKRDFPDKGSPLDPVLDDFEYSLANIGPVTVRDESSKVGQLASMSILDKNRETISSSSYTYQNATQLRNQGVINEVFLDARRVRQAEPNEEDFHLIGVVSTRTTIPTMQASMTTYDRKTGITSTQWNVGYDFYSGVLLKKKTADSRGNYFLDEGIPAYRQYWDGMGPLLAGGKNMLIQSAGSQKWKMDEAEEKVGLLSASVQTWSDNVEVLGEGSQPGIWRKEATYNWNGKEPLNSDGTYSKEDFDLNVFNYSLGASNLKWLRVSLIDLYDVNSNALQAVDVNGQVASTRMDKNRQRVIASSALSSYWEMTYSGAEQEVSSTLVEGDVNKGNGQLANIRSHTGQYSLVVPSGGEGFNYTIPASSVDVNNKYFASVWMYLPGNAESASEIDDADLYYEINGVRTSISPELLQNKSKSWYLVNLMIEPNGVNDIKVGVVNGTSRGVYLDDFRVHPVNSTMTSYVYDNLTDRLIYILDADNLYTHFEYDFHGRLIKTTKEHMNFSDGTFRADQTVSETTYNYGEN
ncbi:MAG: hypothetical protein AAF843_10345 [Bacteroidota bacterium]